MNLSHLCGSLPSMSTRPLLPARVVAPPSGTSVQTRLRLTDQERTLLRAIGEHLGRARGHDLTAALRGDEQNARAKQLGIDFGIHSRYAGTVARANDAQIKLAREGLWRHKLGLQRGIATLERRLAATTRRECGCADRRGCDTCRDGYANRNEWWTKRRRLDVLRARLVEVDRRLAAKDYAIVFGGRRLANTRHHLQQAGLSVEQWKRHWDNERLFLACVGNVGKAGGNPCLTLSQDADGRVWLTVSVPKPVQQRLGVPARVRLTHQVPVGHVPELVERVTARASTAMTVDFRADCRTDQRTEKVLLRASWAHEQPPTPPLAQLRIGRVVSLDLNADHLALARLNPDGNPVGTPIRIPLELKGPPAGTRDARIREAITNVIGHARAFGATAIVVEELGFETEKTREKHGRKKTFRALISGFPTTAFRNRLVPMAYRAGLAVVAVDPRYTSKAGGRDWQHILAGGPTAPSSGAARSNARASDVATRHAGAAVAIGRRGLAHGLTANTPARARARARQQARLQAPVLSSRPAPHQQPAPSGPAVDGSATGESGQVWLSDSARLRPQRPTRPADAARSSPRSCSASIPGPRAGRGSAEPATGASRASRIGFAATQPSG
jgi:IS605 OrfB family transposase